MTKFFLYVTKPFGNVPVVRYWLIMEYYLILVWGFLSFEYLLSQSVFGVIILNPIDHKFHFTKCKSWWWFLMEQHGIHFAMYNGTSLDHRISFTLDFAKLECSINKSGNLLNRKQNRTICCFTHLRFLTQVGKVTLSIKHWMDYVIEQRIQSLRTGSFAFTEGKMFRKNSQDITPSRKSSQDLSTSPTPSGQRRASLLIRKVSLQALTMSSVLRYGALTFHSPCSSKVEGHVLSLGYIYVFYYVQNIH